MRREYDAWLAERSQMEHEIWQRDSKADASRMYCPNCHADRRGGAWLDADKTELACSNCEHTWTPLPRLSWSEKNRIRHGWQEAHPAPENPGDEPPHGRAFMQSFLIGYASVVGSRLAKQRKETVKVAEDSAPGTALAVIDRDKAVDAFAHKRWDYNGSAGRGASSSSNAGYYSGQAAGARANLGSRTVGGGHKAIGGGRS
jgi:hypothetical protein